MAGSTNPTSRAGTTGHCSSCKKDTHIATSALGKRHHGAPTRVFKANGPATKIYTCGGKWTAGPAPK